MNKDDLISALIQEEDMLTPGRILVSALGSSLEDHLKECILEGDIEKTGIPSLKISRESMDVLESAVSGSKLETAMRVYRAHKDRFDTKIRHQLSPTQLRISDPQLLTKVTDCYNVVAEEQKRITIKIDEINANFFRMDTARILLTPHKDLMGRLEDLMIFYEQSYRSLDRGTKVLREVLLDKLEKAKMDDNTRAKFNVLTYITHGVEQRLLAATIRVKIERFRAMADVDIALARYYLLNLPKKRLSGKRSETEFSNDPRGIVDFIEEDTQFYQTLIKFFYTPDELNINFNQAPTFVCDDPYFVHVFKKMPEIERTYTDKKPITVEVFDALKKLEDDKRLSKVIARISKNSKLFEDPAHVFGRQSLDEVFPGGSEEFEKGVGHLTTLLSKTSIIHDGLKDWMDTYWTTGELDKRLVELEILGEQLGRLVHEALEGDRQIVSFRKACERVYWSTGFSELGVMDQGKVISGTYAANMFYRDLMVELINIKIKRARALSRADPHFAEMYTKYSNELRKDLNTELQLPVKKYPETNNVLRSSMSSVLEQIDFIEDDLRLYRSILDYAFSIEALKTVEIDPIENATESLYSSIITKSSVHSYTPGMKQRVLNFCDDCVNIHDINAISLEELTGAFRSARIDRNMRNLNRRMSQIQFYAFFDDITLKYIAKSNVPSKENIIGLYTAVLQEVIGSPKT